MAEIPKVSSGDVLALGSAVFVGGVAGYVAGKHSKKTKKNGRRGRRKRGRGRRRITHTSRGWKQDRKRKSKQSWEVAYRKRKKKSGKRKSRRGLHYTKKGQPYIILKSGKARFVKKK